MLKALASEVWFWDVEWVPCARTGRAVYGLPASMTDAEVVAEMYVRGGATPENPKPYLKTALCQVVSISAVKRKGKGRAVNLELVSVPAIGGKPRTEGDIVAAFLSSVGAVKPQLVGFNTIDADLPCLLQRAVANSVVASRFAKRPAKPWEGIDYFGKYSEHHIDLKQELSGWGKGTPSFHELAVSCGIPGKMGTSGADVADLHAAGDLDAIVRYNQLDVLSGYELLLRVLLFCGFVTPDEHEAELEVFRTWLAGMTEPHALAYLLESQRLRGMLAASSAGAVQALGTSAQATSSNPVEALTP